MISEDDEDDNISDLRRMQCMPTWVQRVQNKGVPLNIVVGVTISPNIINP